MRMRKRSALTVTGLAFAGMTTFALGAPATAGAAPSPATAHYTVVHHGCDDYWGDCDDWGDDDWGGNWNSNWNSNWNGGWYGW